MSESLGRYFGLLKSEVVINGSLLNRKSQGGGALEIGAKVTGRIWGVV